MKPKSLLVPNPMAVALPISITLAGDLTTAIQFAGSVPVSITLSGSLTTAIQMVATINVNVGLSGPLFAAKMARRLQACGHPMFTKCERQHLGEES